MLKQDDSIEFKNDFVYSYLLFSQKILRQVVKIGKGSKGKIIYAHKHGKKTFCTVDVLKPKALEIINISKAGKATKTKKYEKLLPDIEKSHLEKIVKKV